MKQLGQLQAHAWVECNGEPLNDQADVSERYLPLDSAEALQLEMGA